MKIESLNCPNCGAGVSSDKTRCEFCRSRLKTMACPSCFGLMFIGSRHCSHCGAKTVRAQAVSEVNPGDCPRCETRLDSLQINDIKLRECNTCDGLWSDAETFENICADNESQAAVLGFVGQKHFSSNDARIQYVPCPDCRNLMNRNNFARVSGVIIDICKQHGIWFDAEELPKIIEFIRKGGLSRAREKEKLQLKDDMRRLRDEQRGLSLEDSTFDQMNTPLNNPSTIAIREFVRFLFD